MADANEVTMQHIERVQELLGTFCREMTARALRHDMSKFDPAEAGPLQAMQDVIDRDGPAPYGSEEYSRRTAMLGPMLEHHYKNNSHHPEHYENGVAGMDLFDLVEMFHDWKAASERGREWRMNISFAGAKYNIDPMLLSILKNTAERMGWRYE